MKRYSSISGGLQGLATGQQLQVLAVQARGLDATSILQDFVAYRSADWQVHHVGLSRSYGN